MVCNMATINKYPSFFFRIHTYPSRMRIRHGYHALIPPELGSSEDPRKVQPDTRQTPCFFFFGDSETFQSIGETVGFSIYENIFSNLFRHRGFFSSLEKISIYFWAVWDEGLGCSISIYFWAVWDEASGCSMSIYFWAVRDEKGLRCSNLWDEGMGCSVPIKSHDTPMTVPSNQHQIIPWTNHEIGFILNDNTQRGKWWGHLPGESSNASKKKSMKIPGRSSRCR